ncbi:hypothetical protein FRC01_006322 [Tulasnella sp. 417]|nr:hypothetical protein FRC01_006322 [Tulasnella sp. 417]
MPTNASSGTPSSARPATSIPNHSGESSTLPHSIPAEDGMTVPRGIVPSSPNKPSPSTPPGQLSITPPPTAGRQFRPGGKDSSLPTTPSPGLPSPKGSSAIKVNNINTGEAITLRSPDGVHGRTLSRDTATSQETSTLRKALTKTETQEQKGTEEGKEQNEEEKRQSQEEEETKKKTEKGEPLERGAREHEPPQFNWSTSKSTGPRRSGFSGEKGSAPFVGGNFASKPSKMTSEERFAILNRDKAVSGGWGAFRGSPVARNPSQSGVSSLGNPSAAPPWVPRWREQNRMKSQRARYADLQQSENRWIPATRSKLAVDKNSPEFIERKVKALLNKLTLENFDSVSKKIIRWANKSENEKNGATLISVIKLVFERAIDEAHSSEIHPRLCRKMMEWISPNVQDDNIRNNSGEPIVGGHLFRKYLLNRCQEDFERGWSQKKPPQAEAAFEPPENTATEDASKTNVEGGGPVLYSDEYYARLKARRQGLGLVRFIGGLFKLQMLTERIMHECIKKLLSKIDNPEEEELESLCELLMTVGQVLDTPKAKGHMDIYFGRMQMLADNPNVGWRIRYRLLASYLRSFCL